MQAAAGRRESAADAVAAVRAIRRHELLRIVMADLVGVIDLPGVGAALTDLTASTVQVALEAATREVERRDDAPIGGDILVVAMGSFGGRELGYASDADVMFVHQPHPGSEEKEVQARATLVVQELRKLLTGSGADPALGLDPDLRPEGKAGPLVRSVESFRTYYERWALTWEFQALLRAAPIAGPAALADAFFELVDPLRWPDGGISDSQVRDIRTLKARVESERLPRGADPRTHLKLGRGGLTDVEWVVQLHQLQHAHSKPSLRVTGTMAGLAALRAEGLIATDDAKALQEAWQLGARMRNAGVLWRGRPIDSVPSDLRDLDGIGRIMGRSAGEGAALAELWRRVARRSRHATSFNFYESPPRGSVIP
jgi:glutamate-ammonia-ligase adenylyltransferase